MSDIEQLQIPLIELEVAALMNAAREGLSPIGMLFLRRLAFERSTLRAALAARDAELERLREAARKLMDQCHGPEFPDAAVDTYDAAFEALAALLPPTPKEG